MHEIWNPYHSQCFFLSIFYFCVHQILVFVCVCRDATGTCDARTTDHLVSTRKKKSKRMLYNNRWRIFGWFLCTRQRCYFCCRCSDSGGHSMRRTDSNTYCMSIIQKKKIWERTSVGVVHIEHYKKFIENEGSHKLNSSSFFLWLSFSVVFVKNEENWQIDR